MSTEPAQTELKYLVSLRDVERQLAAQMKALQGPHAGPVHRARMSNLVIFCTSLEQAILLNEQVPAISAVHPARVLLLVGEPGPPERNVTARVTVRPIAPGRPHHTCAEQVTLHAAGAGVDRLPFAVRSLLIGDLPVNLWWATPEPPPLAGPLLYELGEHAQQIIYDSIGWRDPARGMAATAAWLQQVERPGGRWRVASDLNWRRLKYWQRLLTQTFDPAATPAVAEATEVVVEHGPHAVIQAWELVSWMAGQLHWTVQTGKVSGGVEMTWRFSGPGGATSPALARVRRLDHGPWEVRRVRVVCKLDGRPGALNMTVEDGPRLAIRLEGVEAAPRTVAVPPQSPAELVGRQLSDRERDPEFRAAMAVAEVMARSLLE
jgi:glucose-6-phosphate dehydrogenase assembly protein OpcA